MPSTVWKGQLSFGLVSIPVRIYKAARAEKIRFRQLHRRVEPDVLPPTGVSRGGPRDSEAAGPQLVPRAAPDQTGASTSVERPSVVTPIHHAAMTEEHPAPIPAREISKGYEYEPDRYALIEAEDLRSITPKTSRDIEILEFVHFTEIDSVYLETSYYVAPDPGGEKPYALLYQALQKTGYAALAQIAMHRREHVAIIRAGRRGLILHTMFYSDEVRNNDEYRADAALVMSKELDLATKLVAALAGKFEPDKYRDRYREQLQAIISAKIQGRDVAAAAEVPAERQPVVDIMEALKKSLAAARKPVAKAETASPKKAGHRKTRSSRQ